MNKVSKGAAIALVAGAAMMGVAGSASAATLLSFSVVGTSTNFVWTEASTTKKVGHTSVTTYQGGSISTPLNDIVSVTLPGSNTPVQAYMTFAGSAAGSTVLNGTNYQQQIDSGTFTFKAIKAFTYDGQSDAAGTVLLAGAFTDALLTGSPKSTLGNVNVTVQDINSISTGIKGIELGPASTDAFGLSLVDISSGLKLKGNSLQSFKSAAAGTFTGATVPEPASWAMMLVGFGGLGAAMRAQRKKQALSVA